VLLHIRVNIIGMGKERFISYKICEHKKNSFVIATIVLEILEFFALCDKLVSITLDNSSANLNAINFLELGLFSISKDLFHVRCVVHLLNLVVGDSVKLFDSRCDKVENAFFFHMHSTSRIN